MPRKVAEGRKQKQKKEIIPEGRKAIKREREPEDTRPEGWKDIENRVNLNVERIINITKFPRSPVKDLIHSFEQLANKNKEINTPARIRSGSRRLPFRKYHPIKLKGQISNQPSAFPKGSATICISSRNVQLYQQMNIQTKQRSKLVGLKIKQ